MKTMKRILSVLLCMAMVIGFIPTFTLPARAADEGTWTLVTSIDDLAAGDQVIIAAVDSAVALSTTQNTNNRGQANITKSSDKNTLAAAPGSSVQILTLEEGKTAGTLAFYTGSSGYLYAAGGTDKNNYLKTKTTKDATASFNVTITSATTGEATIVCSDGTVVRNTLMYNSSSSLFSCYASGQKAVCFYKFAAAAAPDPDVPACEHPADKLTPGYGDTQHWDLCECGVKVNVENHTLTTVSDGDETHTTTCSGCDYTNTVAHVVENYVCTANCGYTVDSDIPAKEGTYNKVTEALTDWSGTYLIVYEDGNVAFNGAYTDLDVASNTVPVEIADNKIAASGAATLAYFVIEAVEGGYSIKSSSGLYIGQTANSNGLRTSDSAIVNTLSYSDGVVITCGTTTLRFNSATDQMRFRYYKSGQKAIALYKLQETTEEPATVDIVETNVTLGNSLAISFFVDKAKLAEGVTYAMKLTRKYSDGREAVTTTIPMDQWGEEGTQYRVKYTGIAAKEMGDEVTAQVVLQDGTPAGKAGTESIKAYAYWALTQDDAKLKTLAVDMLNYGAAAQNYWDYDKENLVNADLTPAQQDLATKNPAYDDAFSGEGAFVTDAATLKDSIILRMSFKDVTEDMHAVVEYERHGGEPVSYTVEFSAFIATTIEGFENVYDVPVNTLSIADGKRPVTCTLYKGTEIVGEGTSSVADYLGYMAGRTDADPIFDATLKVVTSAYNFFH